MGSFISTLVALIVGGALSTLMVYGITCAVTKKAKPRKITIIVFMMLFLITSFAVGGFNKIAVVIVAILFIVFGIFINNSSSGDGNNEK